MRGDGFGEARCDAVASTTTRPRARSARSHARSSPWYGSAATSTTPRAASSALSRARPARSHAGRPSTDARVAAQRVDERLHQEVGADQAAVEIDDERRLGRAVARRTRGRRGNGRGNGADRGAVVGVPALVRTPHHCSAAPCSVTLPVEPFWSHCTSSVCPALPALNTSVYDRVVLPAATVRRVDEVGRGAVRQVRDEAAGRVPPAHVELERARHRAGRDRDAEALVDPRDVVAPRVRAAGDRRAVGPRQCPRVVLVGGRRAVHRGEVGDLRTARCLVRVVRPVRPVERAGAREAHRGGRGHRRPGEAPVRERRALQRHVAAAALLHPADVERPARARRAVDDRVHAVVHAGCGERRVDVVRRRAVGQVGGQASRRRIAADVHLERARRRVGRHDDVEAGSRPRHLHALRAAAARARRAVGPAQRARVAAVRLRDAADRREVADLRAARGLAVVARPVRPVERSRRGEVHRRRRRDHAARQQRAGDRLGEAAVLRRQRARAAGAGRGTPNTSTSCPA